MSYRDLLLRIFPFLRWRPLLSAESLQADLLAGITGAIIVLPQGVAFAMIAGLPPEYGLYTAMITPIIAALFGSSFHLVSGPTTAISLVVFAAISKHAVPGSELFIQLVITQCFLVGLFQLLFGLVRMGNLVNFVSHTVITGFTAGAAILIISSQLPHVLGIELEAGLSFLDRWISLIESLNVLNYWVLLIGGGTWVMAMGLKRFFPKLPYMLLAMLFGSLLNLLIGGAEKGVPLVGEIGNSLPALVWPDLSFASTKLLAADALVIALLGLIQSVAIAKAIALQSKQEINANQEFVGQGLSNLIGSFFSCYAGSGSFTRSGLNYQSGAKTPIAAIFASLILGVLVVLFASFAAYLPLPSMGGIILMIGVNLIDVSYIKGIFKENCNEVIVLLVTFFSALFLSLAFAIYLGVLASALFFLYKSWKPKLQAIIRKYKE